VKRRILVVLTDGYSEGGDLSGLNAELARAEATVYLESELGDPVLVTHRHGLGRVAAMPGGLGTWARDWVGWSGWAAFVGGVHGWLARPVADAGVRVEVEQVVEGMLVRVDAVDSGGRGGWSRERAVDVRLSGPTGEPHTFALIAEAPGGFAAQIPAESAGEYSLVIAGKYGPQRRSLRLAEPREELGHPDAANLQERLLRLKWDVSSTTKPESLQTRRARVPLRGALLAASLIGYVTVLCYEKTRC
jgi:hypothetical protein